MKRIALAALLATGLAAGVAQAQAPFAGGGNVVGGGSATIVGGGDNMTTVYSSSGAGGGSALQTQVPRLARALNGFGNMGVQYLEPELAAPGREAWMVGGGDGAEVVYARPR